MLKVKKITLLSATCLVSIGVSSCDIGKDSTGKPNSAHISSKGVLTTASAATQDSCALGIDTLVTKNDIKSPIYKGFINKYDLYYKCKYSNKIIPITKEDKLSVDSALYYAKKIKAGSYSSVVNGTAKVGLSFDDNLSTYVLSIDASGAKYTGGNDGYPNDLYNFIKDLKFTHNAKQSVADLGKFNVINDYLPEMNAYSNWEIKNSGFDGKTGKYITNIKDGLIIDVNNLQGLYQGKFYPIKVNDDNIKVTLDMDVMGGIEEQDNCKKSFNVTKLNNGQYNVNVDLTNIARYNCVISNYRAKLSVMSYHDDKNVDYSRWLDYSFPVVFENMNDFNILDVSIVDFTGAELKELYVPQVGSYKYYINNINVANNYSKDFKVSFKPADVGKLVINGARLEEVKFNIDDPRIKVGQDNNGWYVSVIEKSKDSEDIDTTLNMKTTWKFVDTGNVVKFDSKLDMHAVYGSNAFDDIKFEYYNDKNQLVDLKDPIDPDGPVYIWEKGRAMYVRVTGKIVNSSQSAPRVDITSLLDPNNWTVGAPPSSQKDWKQSTSLAWDQTKNAVVQAGIAVGQDYVDTYVEQDDGFSIDYLVNSKMGIPIKFNNFKVETANVLNHVNVNNLEAFRFNFDLLMNVGDDKIGESSIVCHGTSLVDCGGVDMYVDENTNHQGVQVSKDGRIPLVGKYNLYLNDSNTKAVPSNNQLVNFSPDYNEEWNMSGNNDIIGSKNYTEPTILVRMIDLKPEQPNIFFLNMNYATHEAKCFNTSGGGYVSCDQNKPKQQYFFVGYPKGVMCSANGAFRYNCGTDRATDSNGYLTGNLSGNFQRYLANEEADVGIEDNIGWMEAYSRDKNYYEFFKRSDVEATKGNGSYLHLDKGSEIGIHAFPTKHDLIIVIPSDSFSYLSNIPDSMVFDTILAPFDFAGEIKSASAQANDLSQVSVGFRIAIRKTNNILKCKDYDNLGAGFTEGSCSFVKKDKSGNPILFKFNISQEDNHILLQEVVN